MDSFDQDPYRLLLQWQDAMLYGMAPRRPDYSGRWYQVRIADEVSIECAGLQQALKFMGMEEIPSPEDVARFPALEDSEWRFVTQGQAMEEEYLPLEGIPLYDRFSGRRLLN